MKLGLCGHKIVSDPDPAQLCHWLREYSPKPDFFAILEHDDRTYMQVAGEPTRGFVLEYQEGSTSAHYRCTDEELSLDTVEEAMTLYLQGDERWRTMLPWRPYDLRTERQTDVRLMVLIAVACVLAAVLWLMLR